MTKAELYKKACMLPLLPGVYIIRDKSGTIIYIGKAKRLRIRVSQYFREGVPHDNKVSQMIAHAYAFDVIVCQSEFEALVLEASQIKAHTPKYNILLKDDKGYSYIKVTKDEWPRLSFTLQKEDDGAEYIGPYTSSFAARQMAETAMDAFLLPRCSRRFPQEIGRGRPCLNAHIGKCMAVCSGKISRENYEQAVKSAVHLIRYGKKNILKTLNERMLEASDRLEFETAALIRDQIAAITKVTAGQKVVVDPDVEMDVVALAGTPGSVCAAVLRFREGRLTDKREFLFHDTADIAAVREEFLPRYYLDDEQIPKVIAVDELPPDVDALQQALNEKRGSEVQLYVPQRGDKAHLVEMAHTNAVERLARESGRYAREEKLLDEVEYRTYHNRIEKLDSLSACREMNFELMENNNPNLNHMIGKIWNELGQKENILSTKVIADFRDKAVEHFHPVDGMNGEEIEEMVSYYVQAKIIENNLDAQVENVILSGSRCRGIEKNGSYLDVVVDYKGTVREDDFFNILHEDGFEIAGIVVDINPITEDKTGPLVEYLESAEQFLQEKMQEKKLEKRSVREKIKLAKQVPQKREKAKLEKSKNTERKHEDYLNR